MSKRFYAIIAIAVIVIGCSVLANGGDDNESPTIVPPASGTAVSEPTRAIIGLPTATPEPTAVLPLSGPHADVPRSVGLAYFHIAPEDGEPAHILASRAQFVTLTHGDEDFRDGLRAAGYTGFVLQFLVAAEVNGPGPYRDSSAECDAAFRPLRNGIVRGVSEFCTEIHPNEDWFLHNGAGERLYNLVGDTGVWYHMNPASPGWRAYALARIRSDAVGLDSLGFDGILLDNVELSLVKVQEQLTNADGVVQEVDTDRAYRESWIAYLAEVSGAIRPDAELWANMTADPNDGENWEPYLEHLDGAMFPAFATGYEGLTVSRWVNNLEQAEMALQMGKRVVAVGLGAESDRVKQQFALGSYLLITGNGDSWFRYVSGESRDDLNAFWMYPNYDVTLGEPLGPRYRNGDIWRRDFRCGYVQVSPRDSSAEIVQTECSASE